MERRRFIAAVGFAATFWKTFFPSETRASSLPTDEIHPNSGSSPANPIIAAGFVAVVEKLLPLAETVLGKLFGKNATDKTTVTKKAANDALTSTATELKNQAASVNDDVKYLTAWRTTAAIFGGVSSIKDSLTEVATMAENGARYSDSALKDIKDSVTKTVGDAASRLQKIVDSGSLLELPEADVFAARSSTNKVLSNLKLIAQQLDGLSKAPNPAAMRPVLLQMAFPVNDAIQACDDITFSHEDYQIRLSNDFLEYMQKFGAQPSEQVKQKAQSKTNNQALQPIPLNQMREALNKIEVPSS